MTDRLSALVERFQTLWSMRHADPAAVAAIPGMTRPLAERVVQTLRERYS
jgi:excinuclease UvrABC nuclease subunit